MSLFLVGLTPLALSDPFCLSKWLCFLFSYRAAVHAIPSLPSLVLPTRLPSSPSPPLNPWRPCRKPTSPLGLTGWTDFARACRCPALPARISCDLQVKIRSTSGRLCHNMLVEFKADSQLSLFTSCTWWCSKWEEVCSVIAVLYTIEVECSKSWDTQLSVIQIISSVDTILSYYDYALKAWEHISNIEDKFTTK